jgi:putative colanic acid biosynthesis acetyltransferase WcaF
MDDKTLQTADSSAIDRPIFQTLDKTAAFPYSKREYARRFLWNIVRATLFRLSLPRAYGWRRWLLRIFGAKIGPHSGIRRGVKIFHPWLFEMGDWSMLADGVVIYNLGTVKIGAHTVLSQDVYVCAGTHDYTNPTLPLERPPIMIGHGVWIAAGAFIGPGVTIGDNSVVGARAVVMKDVESAVVVAGNPAKVLKSRPLNA